MSIRFETENLVKFLNLANARVGQRGAINCLVERARNNEQHTALVIPTRYGKSDIVRAAAYELHRQGIVSKSIIMVPSLFLRGQMANGESIVSMKKRLKMEDYNSSDIYEIDGDSPNWKQFFSNKSYTTGIATVQWVNSKINFLEDWIKKTVCETGLQPVFFIDESHNNSSENSWGETADRLSKAGAKIVWLTATPVRADGKRIPGFDYEEHGSEKNIITKRKPSVIEGKTELSRHEKEVFSFRLIPHYEYSFKRAWEQEVIARVNLINIDPKVLMGEENIMLSEMSISESKFALTKAVRHPKVIDYSINKFVEEIRLQRSLHNQWISGIIFCGSDREDDEEDDTHIKRIEKHLTKAYPEINFRIATSADKEASKTINEFRDPANKIDILVVKQMASVGLDVIHLKVALDLSVIRTVASCIQRIMRIGTIYGNIKVGSYMTVADPHGAAIFREFIEEQGGLQTYSVIGEAIETELVDTIDTSERETRIIEIDGVENGKVILDSDGMTTTRSLDEINLFMRSNPEFQNFTKVQIAVVMDKLYGMKTTKKEEIKPEPEQTFKSGNEILKEISKNREGLVARIGRLLGKVEDESYRKNLMSIRRIVNKRLGENQQRSWSGISENENRMVIRELERLYSEVQPKKILPFD